MIEYTIDKNVTDDIYGVGDQGNPLDKVLREEIGRLVEEFDNFVLAQFERHGYSRDAIIELIHEGRAKRKYVGDNSIFYVDAKELFSITRVVKETEKMENGLYHTEHKLVCIDAPGTTTIMED